MDDDLPVDGWWPGQANAPVCQWFRKDNRSMAQVVRQARGWCAFSMIELNDSGTAGKQLGSMVATRLEAQQQAEAYVVKEGERSWVKDTETITKPD